LKKKKLSDATKLFTAKELKNLAVPLPDRIIRSIRAGKLDQALSLCEEMKKSRIVLHDFLADSSTILWSWVGENLGEEIIENMFKYIFAQSAKRQLYDVEETFRIYPKFTVSLLAEAAWRSHCCFGYGEYPAEFSISEDPEKFTFHMHPCASGGRLWLKGIYEPGRGGKLTEKAHRWSFNRKGLPYYCIHSAFLNEILPYQEFGYLMWPTDEPKGPEDECRWHIYKDPNDIPQKYYDRLGFEKKNIPPVSKKRKKALYFSKDELKEIARPMTDRIQEKILDKDLKEAVKLCRDVRDEFLFLHDLYMNMILATLTFISNEAGESALGEALAFQFEKCIKGPLLENFERLPVREKIEFLAIKIFGIDNCWSTGLPKGKFTIAESDQTIVFTLSPCGSGGRLLRGSAYKPMSQLRKWGEKILNSYLIYFNRFFTMPEALMKLSFNDTGGIVTQRKPYGQGKTKQKFSWSFKKMETPYFCCQCGMLQEKSGKSCLEILPPENASSPCIWTIHKKAAIN